MYAAAAEMLAAIARDPLKNRRFGFVEMQDVPNGRVLEWMANMYTDQGFHACKTQIPKPADTARPRRPKSVCSVPLYDILNKAMRSFDMRRHRERVRH